MKATARYTNAAARGAGIASAVAPRWRPTLGAEARVMALMSVLVDLRPEQLAVCECGPPQARDRERDDRQRQPVEDHGRPLRVRVADRLRHQPGRVGEERHEQEQQQVDPHHPAVDELEPAEDAVVREPQAADRDEAGQVAEVLRPLVEDAVGEVVQFLRGHRQVEHQQRDRDREHAVAERLGAARLPAAGHACAPRAGTLSVDVAVTGGSAAAAPGTQDGGAGQGTSTVRSPGRSGLTQAASTSARGRRTGLTRIVPACSSSTSDGSSAR